MGYVINCAHVDTLPTIQFKFAGASNYITLNGQQQVLETSNCQCVLVFTPGSETVFGSPFLSAFLTTFNFSNLRIEFYETLNQQPSCRSRGRNGNSSSKQATELPNQNSQFSRQKGQNTQNKQNNRGSKRNV
jgi:hypothetical protein